MNNATTSLKCVGIMSPTSKKSFTHLYKYVDIPKGITLKKYKTFRGKNGVKGINVDLYFKNHKTLLIDFYSKQDGYEHTIVNDHTFNSLLNLAEVDNIDDLSPFISYLLNKHIIKKNQKKGIIVGNSEGFTILGFAESIPTFLKKYKGGLEAIQDLYNMAKLTNLTPNHSGSEIVNSEYLKSIGIKL